MEAFLLAIQNSDKMPWILGAITTALIYIIRAFHKSDSPFDFSQMLADPTTKEASLTKFGTLVALILSSWGLVYLIVHDKLTEMYFTTYMSVWTGYNLISKGIEAISKKSNTEDGQ